MTEDGIGFYADMETARRGGGHGSAMMVETRSGQLVLRRWSVCTAELCAELHRVCHEAPGYFLTVEGQLPDLQSIERWFAEDALPLFCTLDQSHFFCITLDGALIGFAHVLAGCRDPDQAMISLLLLSERYQRRGLGRAAYGVLEKRMREWGMTSCRVAVVANNTSGLSFWAAIGFSRICETLPMEGFLDKTVVMDKRLA